jgi:hypothetical protein
MTLDDDEVQTICQGIILRQLIEANLGWWQRRRAMKEPFLAQVVGSGLVPHDFSNFLQQKVWEILMRMLPAQCRMLAESIPEHEQENLIAQAKALRLLKRK